MEPVCDDHQVTTRLPPGPPLPRLLQTLGFIVAGPRFLEACRRRYGSAVTFGTLFDSGFVMVFDPELVKQVFQGPHEQLRAGEANALLGPVLGERSVLLLDGAEHLRHRRLMLPHLHGQRMQSYAQTMREATDHEIESWPVGEQFALMPSMQSLTLSVIMRAVFGYEPGPAEQQLRARLRAMVEPIARPRGIPLMMILGRLGAGERGALQRFETERRAVDEILFAEIARRRAEPDLAERDDVFSALLEAQDEDGKRLSDQEVRDELVTLLIAGHETTATGLAWTFDLLLHSPEVLERARTGDDQYLDAVIKESLRIRPVIPGVGRVVRGEPFKLGDWVIPPGIEINPSIRVMHRREDLYPDASSFKPERFLRRRRSRYVYVASVRGRHASLPGCEFCVDGDADRRWPRARAGRAAGRRPATGARPVPWDHALAAQRRQRDPNAGAVAGRAHFTAERANTRTASALNATANWATTRPRPPRSETMAGCRRACSGPFRWPPLWRCWAGGGRQCPLVRRTGRAGSARAADAVADPHGVRAGPSVPERADAHRHPGEAAGSAVLDVRARWLAGDPHAPADLALSPRVAGRSAPRTCA